MDIDYQSITIHPNDHAGYYPGATPLTLKLVFSPTDGRIFGAQIAGRSGVDKRIDEIALAIKHHDTIYDLMALEQAYALPSRRPRTRAMAAYVAENVLTHRMQPLYWRELRDADPSVVTLLDVRTELEFGLGSLPGAVNIPLDDLRNRLDELPADNPSLCSAV